VTHTLPNLAQRILALPGISYLEKEVDQWVCYTDKDHWFPDLECETCIDTNLKTMWDYVKTVEPKPPHHLCE
jgi:hypothetical protein